jgi:hypothetical protein
MADNSLQGGADTIRDIDRAGVKTQIMQIDVGGAASESLLTRGQQAMASSVPVVLASNQSAIPASLQGLVSTVNSTATPLGISGVFTGTSEDATAYNTIAVTVFSDVASAADGLQMQQSSNGTNWDNVDFYTIPAATGKTFKTDINAKFFRIVYTNGGTAQTAFRLQTLYSATGHMGSSIRPQDARSLQNDVREVVSYNALYNGTTLDLARGTIANGALVDVSRIAAGANVIGKVGLDQTTPGTTNLVALTAETTKVIGTVNSPTITKGTQSTTGITVQALNDAGRNIVTYYTVIPVLATATDTLQSLTGTKSGATVTATTTPAVVTTGKTLRITRFSATYVATATSGYGIARLRFNTGGVAAITSPVAATLAVAAGTPATANSGASEDASIAEGKEFAAGTGIGISVQGFAAATATAVGYMFVSVSGYEY